MSKTLILCDCMGSQTIDADRVASASGLKCTRIHTELCMGEIDKAAEALAGDDVIVACQQERQRFSDLAAEIGAPEPGFVDLRDRAGWFDGAGDAAPKMAALAAEAALAIPTAKSVDVISEGVCLVIGEPSIALPAAEKLADALTVTVLVTAETEAPDSRSFDVIRGKLKRAQGALGGFSVRIDELQEPIRGGRGALAWTEPKNGASSGCDIIVDLTGDIPLFPAPEKREGYLRADPGRPEAVSDALLTATQMVGTFEKPLYVKLEAPLCAHSRAEKTGCTRCLDICPTGAISPAGEHVEIDPMVCAGCGGCSSVCPSGAISYDAPPVEALTRRLTALASTYRKAGGTAPRLVVHDDWGRDVIALSARYGDGLPADVIPFEVDALSGFGHAECLAALGTGFAEVVILTGPKAERDGIDFQVTLANAMSAAMRIRVIDPNDPDDLPDLLQSDDPVDATYDPILPLGSRRQVTRLSAKALNEDDATLPLPEGAPYGAVLVDTDSCTLCLSCVSLCPSGALVDNEDKPQLRFQEDACLQCGLCANICPENAITLQPQMNLTDTALSQVVLNEEDPFACIECGSLFGVKSTVERIVEKLAGNHSMFADNKAARMIQMCENCRIQAQYHSENSPFAQGERPKTRTTADYFSDRKDH